LRGSGVHSFIGWALVYLSHEPAITHWSTDTGTFVESGTAIVTPTALTESCLIFTGGSSPFTLDTGFPAAAGHYNFGVNSLVPGAVGEFNVTVVQLP
jgi:hypothetical protein